VDGSALLLSWYTNLLSAVALAPIVLLAGEGGAVLDLLAGNLVNTRVDGGMGPTATFLWGSIITVSSFFYHKVS
jgi:GDP-fucose transporter C1